MTDETERLKFIIAENKAIFTKERNDLLSKLSTANRELFAIKKHSIKKANGEHSVDYLMYNITAKADLEKQYGTLQINYETILERNRELEELTKHYTEHVRNLPLCVEKTAL